MPEMLASYVAGTWYTAPDEGIVVVDAATGDPVARVSSTGLDTRAALAHARRVGGPALRRLTFHERAAALKALATHLDSKKSTYYELSTSTGATRRDSAVDIDGGIATTFAFSGAGKRELPEGYVLADGDMVQMGKEGTFVGRHVYTALPGAALQINAFNFPVWGMLEKLAPAVLAGMPSIVKPATQTAYLTAAVVRDIVASGALPEGAVQLVCGGLGDLLDHLGGQDLIAFTGSASTAAVLRGHTAVMARATRFNAETDSLNCSILGPDALAGTPEFDLFVKEVAREMTVKAGQKCTAIRRAMAPAARLDAVEESLRQRLAKVKIGDPREEGVTMGALASRAQLTGVRAAVAELAKTARIVAGDPDLPPVAGNGAFMSPILLRTDDPWHTDAVHDIEAFGPVSTIMPYRDLDDAIALANRGMGSLALSLFTFDNKVAEEFVLGAGAYHGRMVILDRTSAKESTGHGSPLPVLVHGGPGRAGGGEEMVGVRVVTHYMQRTALQGSPAVLSSIVKPWLPGSP